MEWFEIIKWAVGLLAGGSVSLGWILFYKLKRRQLANKVVVDDYKDMQEIVDNYMTKSSEWVDIIDQLRRELLEAKTTIGTLISENQALRAKLNDHDSQHDK